ncbi:MAG: hypothetical protein ACR2JG_13065 [Geodermatophilaceae bacterium]
MSPAREGGTGLFVLVGGWPASGKPTLATAISAELGLLLLAKDDIKEALADELGWPVLDSTWFGYTASLVSTLPGVVVEIRCVVPLDRTIEVDTSRPINAAEIACLSP